MWCVNILFFPFKDGSIDMTERNYFLLRDLSLFRDFYSTV